LTETALWAKSGIDIHQARFIAIHRQIEAIISPMTEARPYDQFRALTELMRQMIDLGFVYDQSLVSTINDSDFVQRLINTLHECAEQWKRGMFKTDKYKHQLRFTAYYLALAGIEIPVEKNRWWPF
jgi:hypothetical protein